MKAEENYPNSRILHLLQQTAQFFQENQRQAYVVGGSVRNILLNTSSTDWDIAIKGDGVGLARRLADKLGGHYANMHDKASRIVVKHAEQETIFDISSLHGKNIEADLRERDFTINAMAIPLSNVVDHLTSGTRLQLIDPLNGAADLAVHCLRAVDKDVFKHDPLRMLRAVRLAMRYSLTIDKGTESLLIHDASLLPEAAPERIHDELYAILGPGGATDRLHSLDNYGLFTTMIPEFIPARGMPQPALHYWDVFEHSLRTVAALERLTTTLLQAPEEIQHSPLEDSQGDIGEISALLQEAEQQGIFSFARLISPAMKMAALLHDIGKPATYTVDEEGNIHFYGHPQVGVPLAQQIMKRLSASTQDRRLIQQVVAHHMRPGQLSQDSVSQRAVRRYFMELGPIGIYVALISLADHLAMRGPEPLTAIWGRLLATVRLLLTRYIRERQSILPPRLLEAQELMRHFTLDPGPLVGQLLEYIADAQAEGRVHSKADALWLVEEKLSQITSR
jgi:poly(A) polymerase